jgi:tRNA(fMet)-specific endonuclease VapC
MQYILDTIVLIPLRDGRTDIVDLVDQLGEDVVASIVSRVELEGGVHRRAETAGLRRAGLDQILRAIRILPFTDAEAAAYADIVAAAGYSRRKLLDRMVAAHAMVAGATLVTLNPEDFADVPGLQLRAL